MTRWRGKGRLGWLAASVSLFLCLAAYQLGLPGLHYDEAKEAGVNAMELLHRAPVTAFRSATVSAFGLDLPLMTQDYIGALNVYLALPFLAATGIGVPNLRLLPLFLAVLGLLALERSISEWLALCARSAAPVAPITLAALVSLTLLAAAPSFVFWQRQGIFVTNAAFPFTFACIWQALRWLRLGAGRALVLSAFCAGMALYAKLLAAWIIAPFGFACAGWWLWQRARRAHHLGAGQSAPRPQGARQRPRGATKRSYPPRAPSSGGAFEHCAPLLTAPLAFLLPLVPFLLFNLLTGGTLASISQNISSSYYGVDNTDIWTNATVRGRQLLQTLRGNHLWYLGAIQQNPLAPWLMCALPAAALTHSAGRRLVGPPLILLAMAFAASLFTVSDLFITHYALLHPLAVAVTGIGLHAVWRWRASGRAAAGGPTDRPRTSTSLRPLAPPCGYASASRFLLALLVIACALLDLRATAAYHSALTRSGGLVDHSDASYHLAYDLRYGGIGAPIVLDWGLEAPIRFLSEGSVTPIEIFGYASLHEPDQEFAKRLEPFLENGENVYLLRAPGNELFRGRRAVFERLVKARDKRLQREKVYTQQDGAPLYERWRVLP